MTFTHGGPLHLTHMQHWFLAHVTSPLPVLSTQAMNLLSCTGTRQQNQHAAAMASDVKEVADMQGKLPGN